jgi:AcrR family transcriptional regulator
VTERAEAGTEGLRERKRAHSRATTVDVAMGLFAERGYDTVTVADICAAAEIAPRTFFRYFPTKEDVVLSDDYDDLLMALLHDRPARESPVQAVRRSLAAGLEDVYAADVDVIRERLQLVLSVPALRARRYEQQRATETLLARELAARLEGNPGDLEVRVVAAAIAAAVVLAVEEWAEQGGDLPGLIDRALVALQHGLTGRRPRR